jgi:hypothetical protein
MILPRAKHSLWGPVNFVLYSFSLGRGGHILNTCGYRLVASRKGSWNYKWRNLATVPEILPGAARLNDKRSAAGRICASNASSCAYASADTIGFTVPVAAASSSARWKRRVERRRICVGAGSSVSLSRIDCRLGQRAFAHIPFPWNTRLRPHEERGLYVRGGGSDFR